MVYIISFPSPPPLRKWEVWFYLVGIGVPLVYAIYHMNDEICHDTGSGFLSPGLWIIASQMIEINFITWLVIYREGKLMVVGGLVWFLIGGLIWILSLIYLVALFVGINVFWANCLNGYDEVGPFFVGFGILSGFVIAQRNFVMVYRVERIGELYLHNSNYVNIV